jgi:GH15 family glucan-1,4-alpha-glucosidase
LNSLELGAIGNCSIAALVDRQARIVWCCFPRLDGDPAFCSLLNEVRPADKPGADGAFSVELEGMQRCDSAYIPNTAVLSTTLADAHGNAVEVVDFAPRYKEHERMFRPPLLVRRVLPKAGRPRIRIRLRPRFDYGETTPALTRGSNHVRFLSAQQALRLTTDAPLSYVMEETAFVVDRPLNFLFGSDERINAEVGRTAREFFERTVEHWRDWVRSLSIPFEWQEAVIRAAITLKLCNYEETGAIVAALTTSIPEAPNTQRNWDYRFCWLRDATFVIQALNRLGATRTMEDYIGFIGDVVDDSEPDRLRPVYGIARGSVLDEWTAKGLAGYRGHGPVRVGNQAHAQVQNDVYGSVVLASAHSFFDKRLIRSGHEMLFERLERLGRRALAVFDQPDAGPWELRGSAHIHTFSSLMCWAAADRLAKIAAALGLSDRAVYWRNEAQRLQKTIEAGAWSETRRSFVSTFGGRDIDASLLLMGEFGFVSRTDPRFVATVKAAESELMDGGFLYRYTTEDDFGRPETAFIICSYWFVDALASIGRKEEARALFERLLSIRNSYGLLSEDFDTRTGELWGNFPQTYSMVGLINSATKLSRRWEDVL